MQRERRTGISQHPQQFIGGELGLLDFPHDPLASKRITPLNSRQPSISICGEAEVPCLDEMEGLLGPRGFNSLNYEDTIRQLDIYYGIVKRQILRYQSPTSGLFPVLSGDTKVGSIRDSIYCAAAIWSLYQAYRRIDDDRGKSHELGQSTVKCMRGILQCWIRQAGRVEEFKGHQCPQHALHSKFDLGTGDVVMGDEEYWHLQIDVVSLWLIWVVQMTSSGLQMIYTQDEVSFVQNLVYYVERAYRTPDYGMWERGSKYNDGSAEIHASSIGMAKAALEAINGYNLFGDKGASWSVIFVDIDAHNRNRSIFETLLPRESSSKNTDVSLIPVISFPAFATHDEGLYTQTKEKIVRKLKGEYGFKRFLRDGYKCVLEDKNSRFYPEGKTIDFENVECEWPLFYLFMVIDGVFKNLPEQVTEYCALVKQRLSRDSNGDPLVPMYFYVGESSMEQEKAVPGSQFRKASEEGSSAGNLFLWGQSMYIIAQLLTSGLVHVNEVDLVRRYLPSYNRPRRAGRYSAFQGIASDLVVQVVLIAESQRLQAMMATYGIQTQTPHEVEPVQIWPPSQLVKVYEHLGVNKKLGLKGRPGRPIGALGTSKIYRVCGQTVLCYPLIFEVSEFYLSHDMALLIDDIKTELMFVGKYWRVSGRPTMVLLIREEHMRDRKFKEMLDLMAELKKGHCEGLKVRIGRLQNLISSSCIEHLDFMNTIDPDSLGVKPFRQVVHQYSGYQSLTDVPKTLIFNEACHDYKTFSTKPTWEIVEGYKHIDGYYARCQLLGFLLKREGPSFQIDGSSVHEHLVTLHAQAGILRVWAAVRYASSLLCQLVDSISPYITTILVNGKQLTFGMIGQEEWIVDKPMSPAEIRDAVYAKVQPHDVVQAVLQQETALYCGKLIVTNPELFEGILNIRLGWILQAIILYKENAGGGCGGGGGGHQDNCVRLEQCSPSEVRRLLEAVLSINFDNPEGQLGHDHHHHGEVGQRLRVQGGSGGKLSVYQKRQIEGCLCRVPSKFYARVWHILKKCPGGIIVAGGCLPQNPTLQHMTLSELNFALIVEQMLHRIEHPEYINIVIELLCVVSTILQRNPELGFRGSLDVDKTVASAFKMFQKDKGRGGQGQGKGLVPQVSVEGEDKENELYPFFNASTATTTGYLARAVVNNILQGDMGLQQQQQQQLKPLVGGGGLKGGEGDDDEEYLRNEQCRIS